MSLKIKVKAAPIKKFCGTYDLTTVLAGVVNENISQHFVKVTIKAKGEDVALIAVHTNIATTNPLEFNYTGFVGQSLKLALINAIGTMYKALDDTFVVPNNWASLVVSDGFSLFKGINKYNETENEGIVVGMDFAKSEQTVADSIKADCGDEVVDGVPTLQEANILYTQVKGTDSNSRYVYIASHKKMKLAMRILKEGSTNSVKVSVRVERVDGNKVQDTALSLLGLSTTGHGHASCHFSCPDSNTVERFMIFFKGCLESWGVDTLKINTIKGLSV